MNNETALTFLKSRLAELIAAKDKAEQAKQQAEFRINCLIGGIAEVQFVMEQLTAKDTPPTEEINPGR